MDPDSHHLPGAIEDARLPPCRAGGTRNQRGGQPAAPLPGRRGGRLHSTHAQSRCILRGPARSRPRFARPAEYPLDRGRTPRHQRTGATAMRTLLVVAFLAAGGRGRIPRRTGVIGNASRPVTGPGSTRASRAIPVPTTSGTGARPRKRFHDSSRRGPSSAACRRQPVDPRRFDAGGGGDARHHALPRARHSPGDHDHRHPRPGGRVAHPARDPRHRAGAHRGAQSACAISFASGMSSTTSWVGRRLPSCGPCGRGSTSSRTATTSTATSGPPTSGTWSTAGTSGTWIRSRPAPSRTTWR